MPNRYYMSGAYMSYKCDGTRRTDGHPCNRWIRRQQRYRDSKWDGAKWDGIGPGRYCWQHRAQARK